MSKEHSTRKETSMSKVLQRGVAMLALIVSLVFATAATAQMPINPWKKAAPFPEPDEELYGAALNGKMYVMAAGTKARPPASTTSMTRLPTSGLRKRECRGRPTTQP